MVNLGLTPTVAGSQVSFNVLNANLNDGYYTLGEIIVPEPSTILLLLCGAGLVWRSQRRARRP